MAGKKLLVADDSLTIQKVIRLALSNEGYEIQAVSDGNDAIQQISLFRPDVVLIDVSLPGKSAFEVKRAINETGDFDELRFVLMSSAFEKVDEPQADEVKFHGRLTKPFDPAHLRQVLTDVLAQVAAKRAEPTALIQRPAPEKAPEPEKIPEKIALAPPEDADPTQGGHLDVEADFLDPVKPADEPPLMAPPPPPESIGELWEEKEPSMAVAPAATVAEAPNATPPMQENDLPMQGAQDDDIKHLTESTIRMSGLDDFQWSVQEPSLKPPAGLGDHGGASFHVEPPMDFPDGMPQFNPERAETPRAEQPVREEPSLGSFASGAADASAYHNAPEEEPTGRIVREEPTARILRPQPAQTMAPPPPPPQPSAPHYAGAESYGTSGDIVPVSMEQMEEMIRRQVQETLEKMAQRILPDVAERVIKAEIHRMLSEQP